MRLGKTKDYEGPMDISRHEEGCTPLKPCRACQAVELLRQKLPPDQMARFIQCVAHGDQSHATSTSVDTLALSVRASNLLKSSGITTIEQLVQKTEKELLQQPNYGRKTVDEIKEELAKLGKKLAGS